MTEISGVYLARLVRSTAVLALPAEGQITWIMSLGFPRESVRADELTLDFDDGVRLIPQLVAAGWLRDAAAERLREIENLLTLMSEQGNGHLWTVEALETAAEWQAVRAAALAALLLI